jgi:hypothetical protein
LDFQRVDAFHFCRNFSTPAPFVVIARQKSYPAAMATTLLNPQITDHECLVDGQVVACRIHDVGVFASQGGSEFPYAFVYQHKSLAQKPANRRKCEFCLLGQCMAGQVVFQHQAGQIGGYHFGYSACYYGALGNAAKKLGIAVENSTMRALVSLIEEDQGGFRLAVELHAQLPGTDPAQAQRITEAAHQTCPYSKALRGDTAVTLVAD